MARCFRIGLLLIAFAVPCRAVDLAALVPDDVGMCFLARDLADHGGRFFGSELFRRLMAFEPAGEFLEEYANRPRLVGELLAGKLGIPRAEFGDKLFGQRSMLAIWPDEFRSAEDSRLLFLTETNDPEFTQRVVDAFCETLNQPGVLVRAEDVSHAGARYSVRVIRRGERRLEICLAAVDNVFLLASGESLMRQALELRSKPQPAPRSLAAYAPYLAARQRHQADSPLSLIILPKRWLDLVTERLDDDDGQPYEAKAKQAVLDGWRVADYWVFAIRTGDRLSLESYLHFDPERRPDWLDQMARGPDEQATFLDHVPADAVVAYAGQLNVSEIGYLILVGAASGDGFKLGNLDDIRKATSGMMMGLDPIDDILPAMGPDVGFFISRTQPPNPVAASFPSDRNAERDKPDDGNDDEEDDEDDEDDAERRQADSGSDLDVKPPTWLEMVVGVRTNRRPAGDKRPEVETALDNGLRTMMILAAGAENAKRGQRTAQVAVTRLGDLKFTTLSGLEQMPSGMDLTYTFTDDFFVGGLSLGTVKRSASLSQADSLAAQPRFRRLLDDSAGQPGQLLYIDCLALRKMLAQDPDRLFQTFSPFREMTQAKAREAQDLIEQLLSLTDTFLLTARVEGTGLSISLAIDSPSPEAVASPTSLQK
ncbi:MAG: hypothetical protein AB7U73_09315 [Pirellulales bacterium]